VSYDFKMAEAKRARADGIDPEFGINNPRTRLVLDLLDAQGALDTDYPGPVSTRAADPVENDPFDQAQILWEAQRRASLDLQEPSTVQVAAVSFSTNDDWKVFPSECRVIARALATVTDDQIQAILEADTDETAVINDPKIDDPADMTTAVANVRRLAERFGEFASRAADYGGFRVS
jgi:hypothetical protein